MTPEDGFAIPLPTGGGLLDYEMDFGMPYSVSSSATGALVVEMERSWRVEDERLSGMTFGRYVDRSETARSGSKLTSERPRTCPQWISSRWVWTDAPEQR